MIETELRRLERSSKLSNAKRRLHHWSRNRRVTDSGTRYSFRILGVMSANTILMAGRKSSFKRGFRGVFCVMPSLPERTVTFNSRASKRDGRVEFRPAWVPVSNYNCIRQSRAQPTKSSTMRSSSFIQRMA